MHSVSSKTISDQLEKRFCESQIKRISDWKKAGKPRKR